MNKQSELLEGIYDQLDSLSDMDERTKIAGRKAGQAT